VNTTIKDRCVQAVENLSTRLYSEKWKLSDCSDGRKGSNEGDGGNEGDELIKFN